jgi:hemoglobin-like flavoprotein
MPAANVTTFLASLKRCLAAPGFLEEFYREFLDSSDEVREKFRETDFHRQTRVLEDSLYVLANAVQGREGSPAWGNLPQIADRHGRKDLDIRPELYDQWLACLLEAVRRHDPEFTVEIEDAWRQTLALGIDYMRSRY